MAVKYKYNPITGDFELVQEVDESQFLTIKSMLNRGFNEASDAQTYVGIDFGTSTTVVSIASYDPSTQELTVSPIRLAQLLEDGARYQSEKMATVIAWYNNTFLVGEGASNLKYKLKRGKDIWYSFKMELGEDKGAKYFDSSVKDVNGISLITPKDCARLFFMYLKMMINRHCQEKRLPEVVKYAVSIPASFEANQRKELIEALEANDMVLTNQALIDEPNAAFISYVYESQKSEKPLVMNSDYNPKVLVFDFGAGTCDISILEIGKANNGLYSKNLAISKFINLGGDDVDRYLVYHYLLPRFLKANNYKAEDFITSERNFIASQLFKVAERLKIEISKTLAVRLNDFSLPAEKNSITQITHSVPISIETSKGILRQEQFYLTKRELTQTMSVFTRNSILPTKIEGEDDYNTIFMSVKSAIEKSNINIDELDYVLLIGGSAQSPYIQEALHNYFGNSTLLVPQDLQTHVSQGAAIHSFLMNGLNKCIIQPITSEPILVITQGELPTTILPAGTSIPCGRVIFNDLMVAREGQTQIELPICVGTKKKLLYNLKITKPGGFRKNASIPITMEITPDKLLILSAECMGERCNIEPQSPFANRELDEKDRKVLEAERNSNNEAYRNGGRPTVSSLSQLRRAYEDSGYTLRAAETYELQYDFYPDSVDLNNIGVLYHNSGVYGKAVDFYEKAVEKSPTNNVILSNLGHSSMLAGDLDKAYKSLMKAYELNPNHGITLIKLARCEAKRGNRDKEKEYKEKAYVIMEEAWNKGKLDNVEKGWFSSLASELGYYNVANEVNNSIKKAESKSAYNSDNLAISRV